MEISSLVDTDETTEYVTYPCTIITSVLDYLAGWGYNHNPGLIIPNVMEYVFDPRVIIEIVGSLLDEFIDKEGYSKIVRVKRNK